MPKEDSLPAPTSATLQFRRPKRGNKTHALDAGPTHDGRHYSAAVCGYRPTGLNPACFGWTDARNCSPCLMCEAVLVARGDLDAASDLTGRLYDEEPAQPRPGDLDKMRFAFLVTGAIDTERLVEASGLGSMRGRAALLALLKRGDATRAEGHHHGDGDLCQCVVGGRPLTHWYLAAEDEFDGEAGPS